MRSTAGSSRTPRGTAAARAISSTGSAGPCRSAPNTSPQAARLDAKLSIGDPDHEVTIAWQRYRKLRNIYHARPGRGRELVIEVISSFPSCPIPEVARLGRTLRTWKAATLASFDTNGASTGPTEAINGVIETARRIARGFRNFPNYRLSCLLAAGGHRPYRSKQPNHA